MLSEFQWNTGTFAILMVFGVPIVATIAFFWHRTIQVQSENELKRSMVERGMSADEIERVLAARPGKRAEHNE